jgi:hypothetical protein
MAQLHGRAVTSEEIERLTGRDFGPAGFASMCNAISWASAKKRPSSLPSFTERVNVRDDGVDAEWDADLPEGDYSSPLLGSGWNVFQYKQRDIAAVGREKQFSKLKSDLKGAVKDLYGKAKRRPDRYVLFVNLDLTHDQKRELKEKVLKGYDRPEEVRVEIAMVADGLPLNAVAERLTREGVGLPYSRYRGVKRWNVTFIRDCIIGDDVYRPHTFEEISALVEPDVASRLDPDKSYGIWWFNRRRSKTTQVSVPDGNGGRRYKQQVRYVLRPREEWIAVPVPDAGVPREIVDAARQAIKYNRAPSNAGRRFWELSGGFVRCGLCGHVMDSHTTANPGRPVYFYYACRTRYKKGVEACSNGKYLAAARVEASVWEGVTKLLKDPAQLRADLNAMIEQKRRDSLRGDPDQEVKLWADKLAEVERKRGRYQDMAASELITFDELRARLLELDETRKTAERELEIIRNHKECLAELEADRDALLASLMDIAPMALESLTPEERRRFYRLLGLSVSAYPDRSLEVEFGDGLNVCERETAQVRCSA